MKRRVLITLLTLFMVGGVLLSTQIQEHRGYFSPVFSPDGRHIYFLVRQTKGLVTGFGWEFFSPPAHVFVWSDRFTLQRMPFGGGETQVIATFASSPLENQRLRTYRGRAFTAPATLLRWTTDSVLEVKLRLSIPVQPSAEMHFVDTLWSESSGRLTSAGEWTQDWVAISGDDESRLFAEWELVTAPGQESFPCAVVGHHATSDDIRVLIESDACARVYPHGILTEHIVGRSRRADIERGRELTGTHARLTTEAVASGMSEHEAALYVVDRMRELGYYSTPPQLVARSLSDEEAERLRSAGRLEPLFVIEEMQFTVGLFQDLERALDAPGTPVDKSMGQYVIHRDYPTSAALNAFLASGGSVFYVKRGPGRFEVQLTNR